jgi:hypothetical protein
LAGVLDTGVFLAGAFFAPVPVVGSVVAPVVAPVVDFAVDLATFFVGAFLAGGFAADSVDDDFSVEAVRATRFAAATVRSARLRAVRAMTAGPLVYACKPV